MPPAPRSATISYGPSRLPRESVTAALLYRMSLLYRPRGYRQLMFFGGRRLGDQPRKVFDHRRVRRLRRLLRLQLFQHLLAAIVVPEIEQPRQEEHFRCGVVRGSTRPELLVILVQLIDSGQIVERPQHHHPGFSALPDGWCLRELLEDDRRHLRHLGL